MYFKAFSTRPQIYACVKVVRAYLSEISGQGYRNIEWVPEIIGWIGLCV